MNPSHPRRSAVAAEVSMKCVCPACGRTTDIEHNTLGFFERCTRCGALIKAQTQDNLVVARTILTGLVREAQTSTGQIAALLSRPLFRRPAPQPAGEPLPQSEPALTPPAQE